ncbi:hypothetical protein Y032_0055g2566 [Ancylostoma ceylanicum]|uniref:Uncharacterized protein n=1 Tax=Ancylostoma ceylanicum TaxID=53326 RepID=A0A016U6A7_9BILA|nr:hypothetical protein Y032_0055g2566 [Ancylostoma ceylanicum]
MEEFQYRIAEKITVRGLALIVDRTRADSRWKSLLLTTPRRECDTQRDAPCASHGHRRTVSSICGVQSEFYGLVFN